MSESTYLLNDEATLQQIARDAVQHARTKGISDCSASASETGGMTMRVKDGAPLSSVRDGSMTLAVTIFDRGRSGGASTAMVSADAIRGTVERAIAIARVVEADEEAGVADPDWLARDGEQVELFAPSGFEADQLSATALSIEAAAEDMGRKSGVAVRVLEAGAASHDNRWARAIGADFCRSGSASSHGRWCTVIAEQDGVMVRDQWVSRRRRVPTLDEVEYIGNTAVTRAVRKIGARTMKTRSAAVLLDATIDGSLVHEVCGALTGSAQHEGSTFFGGALGRKLMPEHLDLIEDPFVPYGAVSGSYDREGVAGLLRHVVRGGAVEGLFLSSQWARKLGMRSTGNANGAWNLNLVSRQAGRGDDLAAMWQRMGTGLWVTEYLGGRANPVTGEYSKAVAGFWIENGSVAFPVLDITIAGNLRSMLTSVVAVGGDIFDQGSVRTGSILIESMRIAGR